MTQMDCARKGQVTSQMEIVARKEGIPLEKLMEKLARGAAVIPANINHRSLDPEGVGEGLRTKINVNLGISRDCPDYEHELEKANLAVQLGAEAIMDLSSYGNTRGFRSKLVEISPAMLGTVPMYDAVGFWKKDLGDITADEFFNVVEAHAEDGIDFMTIHAGINRRTAERFKKNPRLMNIVSRGGSLLFAWMELTGNENPFYEHYDRLLDLLYKYDVTISLGDACRPGCIADATDAVQIEELITLGELTRAAWDKSVQVIVEGPGHMVLDEIAANMKLQKKLCHGAPFYVLGPLVTDIAPGYDHIAGAIGGAIAASAGADFLCYITPAEHLRLPALEDVKEGIMASRIAAHAADIVKGVPGAREWDMRMARARQKLDWEAQFQEAIDPQKARAYRSSSAHDGQTCTMCGRICAVQTINRALSGERVSIK